MRGWPAHQNHRNICDLHGRRCSGQLCDEGGKWHWIQGRRSAAVGSSQGTGMASAVDTHFCHGFTLDWLQFIQRGASLVPTIPR